MHTIHFGCGETEQEQCIAELGANWIHCVEDNPVYRLAKSWNLLQPQITYDE